MNLQEWLIIMARRGKKQSGNIFVRWWEERRDQHLSILFILSLVGLAAFLWSLVFFMFMDGVSEMPELIGMSWFFAIGGLILLGVVGPEFFRYNEQLTLLREVFELESRAEILKRRKEAEEAASLLGSIHQGRLLAHYKDHGIRAGRIFQSPATNFSTEESWIISWWNANNTILSENTGISNLSSPSNQKILIVSSVTGIVLLLWNSFFGIARMTTEGSREYSVDVFAWFQNLLGSDVNKLVEPVSFDVMTIFLLIGFGTLLWSTSPMVSLKSSTEEE